MAHAYRYGTAYSLAVGAASVNSSATPFGSATLAVRLCASTNCWVAIGGSGSPPTAAVNTSVYLSANQPGETVRVSPGECVAVIQSTTAGTLSITELTQ